MYALVLTNGSVETNLQMGIEYLAVVCCLPSQESKKRFCGLGCQGSCPLSAVFAAEAGT